MIAAFLSIADDWRFPDVVYSDEQTSLKDARVMSLAEGNSSSESLYPTIKSFFSLVCVSICKLKLDIDIFPSIDCNCLFNIYMILINLFFLVNTSYLLFSLATKLICDPAPKLLRLPMVAAAG